MQTFFQHTILNCIRAYQIVLSPVMGLLSPCRFSPSCSTYTYEAVEKFGIITGLWMGIRRVLRCNPYSQGGNDPVPQSA